MERFDNEVMPEIEALLQNEDPGYADCYISIVMVGTRRATAKPKILVSCTNSDVRTEVLRIIKGSHRIRDVYPEFGFGESSVPLHEPVPSRPTAGKFNSESGTTRQGDVPAFFDVRLSKDSLTGPGFNKVVAFDRNPAVGRKLFLLAANNEPLRIATGGVVVRISDKYYQKTVGHIDESERGPPPKWSIEDIDFCRFDDDSDDEDDMLEFDCEVTSRGSMTPEDKLSQAEPFDNSETASVCVTALTSAPSEREQYTQSKSDGTTNNVEQSTLSDENQGIPPGLSYIGQLQHKSQASENPGLDYAFVRLDATFNPEKANRICIDPTTSTHIQIRGVVPVAAVERDIVTVTASGGITHGRLMPSAVYLRNHNQRSFQKLYVVRLSTMVVDGDCGADVIDVNTGSLYGHIVRGCCGTRIAYIVSTKDVFEDLKGRLGIVPEIVLPDQTEGLIKHDAESQLIGGFHHNSPQRQKDDQYEDDRITDPDSVVSEELLDHGRQVRGGMTKSLDVCSSLCAASCKR